MKQTLTLQLRAESKQELLHSVDLCGCERTAFRTAASSGARTVRFANTPRQHFVSIKYIAEGREMHGCSEPQTEASWWLEQRTDLDYWQCQGPRRKAEPQQNAFRFEHASVAAQGLFFTEQHWAKRISNLMTNLNAGSLLFVFVCNFHWVHSIYVQFGSPTCSRSQLFPEVESFFQLFQHHSFCFFNFTNHFAAFPTAHWLAVLT